MEKITNHFGVYGVLIKDNKLLCIKKNAGPYQNRYDLPGGSQQIAEGLTETLKREILEETGHKLISYENNRVYDVFVHEEGKSFTVHHIFALYDIRLGSLKRDLPQFVADGKNDSNGIIWINLNDINVMNSSPLVIKVRDEYFRKNGFLNKIVYDNWKVRL